MTAFYADVDVEIGKHCRPLGIVWRIVQARYFRRYRDTVYEVISGDASIFDQIAEEAHRKILHTYLERTV
jgi:hypothetical protein